MVFLRGVDGALDARGRVRADTPGAGVGRGSATAPGGESWHNARPGPACGGRALDFPAMLQDILELQRQGKLDEAEARYRELLTFNPDDPETLHLLATLRRQKGDPNEAVRLVRRAIELVPDRANYYLTLAAIEFHGRAFEQARADFETALKLNPSLTSAYGALGHIAMLQGDGARAEQNFKLALNAGDERVEVLTGYGNLLLARGDHDGAVQYLSRAAELYPQDATAQASLGRAFLAKGLFAFAEQALGNALARKPDYHAARLVLAQVQLAERRYADAEATLRPLFDLPGQRAPALVVRGDAARARGDLNVAIMNYRDALRLDARQPKVVQALAWCLAQTGFAREAIGAYRAYLAERPDDLEAWRALGGLAAEAGAFADARSAYDALLARAPADVAARQGLAAMLELLGELDAAEHEAERVLAELPAAAGAALIKGRAEYRHGRYADAIQRVNVLLDAPLGVAQRRLAYNLRGHAADALGERGQAVNAWLAAHAEGADDTPLPEQPPVPWKLADAIGHARERGAAATERRPSALLLGAPGSGVEHVAALIGGIPGSALLADRLGNQARSDGLSAIEARYAELDDGEAQIQARRYARAIERLPLDPAAALVDWLPLWDARLLPLLHRAFGDTRLIVAVRDPRDALLHWLAFGCPQRVRIGDPDEASAWLARLHEHLAVTLESARLPLLLVDADRALRDAGGESARIAAFLDRPPPVAAPSAPHGLGGLPVALARGRHADYEAALPGAFATLAPLAARFPL